LGQISFVYDGDPNWTAKIRKATKMNFLVRGYVLIILLISFKPDFGFCKDIVYPGPNKNNQERFISCVVKNNALLFHGEKFLLINNRGIKDEELNGYGYPSPDKKSFILMVQGPGSGDIDVSWDIWLYTLGEKQQTKLSVEPLKNSFVGWLNNEIFYFNRSDVHAEDSTLGNIKQPNKFYDYGNLMAVDLSDGLYLSLDQDEKFVYYLEVGKLFNEGIFTKQKIELKDELIDKEGSHWPASTNVNKIEFLSDHVKVQYVSDSGKAKTIFVEYPKK
jgi:hypothetical protein